MSRDFAFSSSFSGDSELSMLRTFERESEENCPIIKIGKRSNINSSFLCKFAQLQARLELIYSEFLV